jgi:hypothetical protein
MLFGETVAVYCENHTEHTDTLCGQNAESVPHRKHIVPATKTNRLMLFGGKIADYWEKNTEHTNTICAHNPEL